MAAWVPAPHEHPSEQVPKDPVATGASPASPEAAVSKNDARSWKSIGKSLSVPVTLLAGIATVVQVVVSLRSPPTNAQSSTGGPTEMNESLSSQEPQPSNAHRSEFATIPTAANPDRIADEPPRSPNSVVQRLASAADPVEDPSKTAWEYYRAKNYVQAQRYFAQVTLAEPKPWKHPFNPACAAALAGDAEVARVGLIEAVSRDRASTINKARHDSDLASVRGNPWFEDVLRGE